MWAAATGQEPQRPAPNDNYWYELRGAGSASGQDVTPKTAIQHATVYACIRVLADTIASLPMIVYKRRADGGKERLLDHPLYNVLHNRANDWQTSFRWREMVMAHLGLRGNSVSYLADGGRGFPAQMIPLHPDRLMVRQDPETLRLTYHYSPKRGPRVVYVAEEVLHLRGLADDGYIGLSPIQMQRETIGAALGSADYGARFWANDARPGLTFTHPGKLGEEAYERLKENVRSSWSGANRHRPAVLEEGMKPEQIGLANKESQFLEARGFSRTEIAAMFRVPPHMVGDLSRATFSNIEHQAIAFVMHTIRPWAVRLEQEINEHPALLGGQDGVFVELLLDGLLRGDIVSRYDAYNKGRTGGWLSVNEIRAKEGMNPIENGDVYLQPMNMSEPGAGTDKKRPPPPNAEGNDDDGDDEEEASDGRSLRLEIISGSERTGTDDAD